MEKITLKMGTNVTYNESDGQQSDGSWIVTNDISGPLDSWADYTCEFTAPADSVDLTIAAGWNAGIIISDFSLKSLSTYSITVDSKNNATIEPVNGSKLNNAIEGTVYSFKVIAEPGLNPTVFINGLATIADAEGIYSFIVESDTVIKIDCGDADEGRPQNGKDYSGNDLTKYNPDLYLTNIWEGDTVYHETALFYEGRETVKLLYPVDEVISLRSYGLDIAYIEGVDFEITNDGLIKILEGSRIPVYEGGLTTTEKPSANAFPVRDKDSEWITSISDVVYPEYAIAVTYKHSTTFEDGYTPVAPKSQAHKLATTIEKLKNGETVNIAIYGDSISSGWSSSGLNSTTIIFSDANDGTYYSNGSINRAPYAPTWMDMVITELKVQYPTANINVINLSLPGMSSGWGASNIAARLALWKDENGTIITPDLLMVGFGVNDAHGDITATAFKNNMQAIVSNARTASGNSGLEVLYYSAFLPNQNTVLWDEAELKAYENALSELTEADDNIGLVKLTSVFAEIVDSKEAVDYLSTNWNHGNDFTARQYATGVLAALTEPDYIPGDIDNNNKVNLNDLVTIAQYVANWDVEVNVSALDVNGDTTVTLDDVVHFARHLAGWEDAQIY